MEEWDKKEAMTNRSEKKFFIDEFFTALKRDKRMKEMMTHLNHSRLCPTIPRWLQ